MKAFKLLKEGFSNFKVLSKIPKLLPKIVKLLLFFQSFSNPVTQLESFLPVRLQLIRLSAGESFPQVNLPLGSPQVVTKMLSGVKVKCVQRGEVKRICIGMGDDWKGSYLVPNSSREGFVIVSNK